MFLFSQGLYAQPEGWSPTSNPSSGAFLGQATIDGIPAEEGDWSAAFDEDGNCAGAAEIIINGGIAYINMPIYGDDTTTPDVDEGMNAGENFILKLWDSSEDAILEYSTSFDCWYNSNGGPMDGCGNYTEVYNFSVPSVDPTAFFTYSTEFLTATFSDASITGSSAIVRWSWDFDGDGAEDATWKIIDFSKIATSIHGSTIIIIPAVKTLWIFKNITRGRIPKFQGKAFPCVHPIILRSGIIITIYQHINICSPCIYDQFCSTCTVSIFIKSC